MVARFDVTGTFAQVAGRLFDVGPDGSQVLVSRGVLRPRADGSREPFQLAPTAYRFEAGHVAKLELLGADLPYLRPSNGVFSVGVADAEVRLPVHEAPDGAAVLPPAAPVLPAGAVLAPDRAPPAVAAAKPRKRDLRVSARCVPGRRVRIGLIGVDTALVRAARIRGRQDRKAPFALTFRRTRSRKITVRVSLRDGRKATLTRKAPRCRGR